jgi:hypothetical protein
MLMILITVFKNDFFTASRLIRRRMPAAGHLMTPRRLWLNKIPTQCDVVVEFPGKFLIREHRGCY